MNILITGANRGLGYQLAAAALRNGHQVVAGTRNLSAVNGGLAELVKSYPDHLYTVPLDVSSEESVQAAVDSVQNRYGRLDAIVNNAAILVGREQKLEQLSMADMEESFDVNLYGPIRVVKHALPLMIGDGDKVIVNISSEAGSFANAYGGDYPYALAKGALNLFSEHVRRYVAGRGIRVYAVHPGWIRTDMGSDRAPGDPAESAAGILALIEGRNKADNAGIFIDHRGQSMSL